MKKIFFLFFFLLIIFSFGSKQNIKENNNDLEINNLKNNLFTPDFIVIESKNEVDDVFEYIKNNLYLINNLDRIKLKKFTNIKEFVNFFNIDKVNLNCKLEQNFNDSKIIYLCIYKDKLLIKKIDIIINSSLYPKISGIDFFNMQENDIFAFDNFKKSFKVISYESKEEPFLFEFFEKRKNDENKITLSKINDFSKLKIGKHFIVVKANTISGKILSKEIDINVYKKEKERIFISNNILINMKKERYTDSHIENLYKLELTKLKINFKNLFLVKSSYRVLDEKKGKHFAYFQYDDDKGNSFLDSVTIIKEDINNSKNNNNIVYTVSGIIFGTFILGLIYYYIIKGIKKLLTNKIKKR